MPIDQNLLLDMLASELDDARIAIEKLSTVLCSNTAVTMAHLEELQALDHVSQRCSSVANILRSRDIYAASQAAPLESITERLDHLARLS